MKGGNPQVDSRIQIGDVGLNLKNRGTIQYRLPNPSLGHGENRNKH